MKAGSHIYFTVHEQLADHQASGHYKEMLLKEEILLKEKTINENKRKYEIDIIDTVKAKEVCMGCLKS